LATDRLSAISVQQMLYLQPNTSAKP
jgi:hypothetical protein